MACLELGLVVQQERLQLCQVFGMLKQLAHLCDTGFLGVQSLPS